VVRKPALELEFHALRAELLRLLTGAGLGSEKSAVSSGE
jgi:hypothetical protein